jgi:mannose-1-phosphate guanylyltransferase / mannose-6-phosphate isomerase
LWPLSRRLSPKQFQPLVADTTLFAATVGRVDGLPDLTAPMVICNADHRPFVDEELRALGRVALSVLLEPVGRNTAPAIAVGALQARKLLGSDPLLLVLPADHVVRDPAAFRAAVQRGIARAEAGELVTFGIVPDRPETGYGYIRSETPGEPSAVRAFVEKPDAASAQAYVDSGEYLWNGGIFLFRASVFLDELGRHRPDMIEPCRAAVEGATTDGGATWLDPHAFASCPAESIDYAVMQKTDRAAVVPLSAGWSDVGSWDALWEACDRDGCGNVVTGEVLAIDTEGSVLDARRGLVAAVGVKDLVIVATEDAVLVASRARAQDVKTIVTRLERSHPALTESHPERPTAWGFAHALSHVAPGVTRLGVRPGMAVARSSAGMPRAIAVSQGRATIVHGDASDTLVAGACTTLPAGCDYEIRNVAGIELVVIEIDAQ